MDECSDDELHPEAAALLEFWRARRAAENCLPSFTQQVESDLHRWIQDLSIVELQERPRRFFVRQHGMVTQLRVGDNLTGLYFEDVLLPIVQVLALAPYEEAIRTALPTRSTMVPKLYPGVFRQLDRMVLPFGDAGKVTLFVTWVGPTQKCGASGASIYDNLSALTDPETGARDLVSLTVLTA